MERLPASTRATPVRYAPAAAVILRRRGRRQRDIASGAQDDLAALDRRDQIAQILARGQVNAAALNSAAGLVDDIAGGDDRGLARADGAAVGRIAVHGNIDTAARQQRAVALQVARAHQQIDLRNQHGFGGAVGQGHGLFDQPDQVSGQLALLCFGQRDAELDAVVLRELGAGREQGLVLRVVVAVLLQEALAGGGRIWSDTAFCS